METAMTPPTDNKDGATPLQELSVWIDRDGEVWFQDAPQRSREVAAVLLSQKQYDTLRAENDKLFKANYENIEEKLKLKSENERMREIVRLYQAAVEVGMETGERIETDWDCYLLGKEALPGEVKS